MTAKIRIYDLGRKKANVDEFPFCAQYALLVLAHETELMCLVQFGL